MRKIFSPLFWLLVVFMVGQGTMPGLVVCLGDDGHAEVEKTQGECCDPSRQPAPEQGGYVLAAASQSTAGDSCGSCTDSPLSLTTALRIKPQVSHAASVAELEIARSSHHPSRLGLKPLAEGPSVVAKATRIPIATTTLLI